MLGLPSTSISRAAEIHGVAIHRAHVCATEPTWQLMSWIRRAEQVKTNTNDLNFLVSLRDADATIAVTQDSSRKLGARLITFSYI